ncbi:MAG: hypothetical protein ACJ780_18010, partial [Solirubrobacteraceae bacterium]
SAATLTADKACYVHAASGVSMTITGSGWIPGTTVHLTAGASLADATADAAGDVIFTSLAAPRLRTSGPGVKTTKLTATATNPDGSQTTQMIRVRSANLSVATKPGSVNNVRKDKVTFFFSGFTPGKHIYSYYLLGKKVVAKDKFGTATGPCGVLKQKALLYPGGRPNHDASTFTITLENTGRYDAGAFPRVTAQVQLFRF